MSNKNHASTMNILATLLETSTEKAESLSSYAAELEDDLADALEEVAELRAFVADIAGEPLCKTDFAIVVGAATLIPRRLDHEAAQLLAWLDGEDEDEAAATGQPGATVNA